MTPTNRTISGTQLSLVLEQEIRALKEQLGSAPERVGRTLVKNGPLRVTLVGVNPGGTLRPHTADGPITVQVLEGEIEFETGGRTWQLSPGSLFSLAPGIAHSVRAPRGGIFLLTVVATRTEARASRIG